MKRMALLVGVVVAALGAAPAAAQEAGHVKVAKGAAQIERSGQKLPATVGRSCRQGDVVTTGADGSVGITFRDSSLVSIGPDSVLAIDRFVFDSTTHQGNFDASLKKGTLAVVSGKLAKQSPDAMKVKTPAAILGVRGTEFLVRTGPERLTPARAGATSRRLAPLALTLLVGCASRDDLYVLLPGKDGKTGALIVESEGQQADARPALCRGAREGAGPRGGGHDHGAGGRAGLRCGAGGAAAAAGLLLPLFPRGHRRVRAGLQAARSSRSSPRSPAGPRLRSPSSATPTAWAPCRTTTRCRCGAPSAARRAGQARHRRDRIRWRAAASGSPGSHGRRGRRAAEPARRDQRPLGPSQRHTRIARSSDCSTPSANRPPPDESPHRPPPRSPRARLASSASSGSRPYSSAFGLMASGTRPSRDRWYRRAQTAGARRVGESVHDAERRAAALGEAEQRAVAVRQQIGRLVTGVAVLEHPGARVEHRRRAS